MPSGRPTATVNPLSQRWCDLAERRIDYFRELYVTGRWKHYYRERQFIERMRDVMTGVEDWRALAGRAPSGMP
jgi:uncharacterized repeat protein (TIGR03809 family)